jgi:hypothetical protein
MEYKQLTEALIPEYLAGVQGMKKYVPPSRPLKFERSAMGI